MANRKSASKTTQEQRRLLSIGVDIGKDVLHIVGFDLDGKIVLRRKLRRLGLEAEFAKLPRCIVGMEACLSAHFVSRRLRALGFEPRIIPSIYVSCGASPASAVPAGLIAGLRHGPCISRAATYTQSVNPPILMTVSLLVLTFSSPGRLWWRAKRVGDFDFPGLIPSQIVSVSVSQFMS